VPIRVLDASAFVELLLRSQAGRRVEEHLRESTVAVPAHFDVEVFSALGRLFRAGEIGEQRVEVGLNELARAPLTRYPVVPLLQGAWALRDNLSLRDALYVTLARRIKGTLLTADFRLARAPSLEIPCIAVKQAPDGWG
jgi:predicted nucleic acid-binding protein